jgi:UDP-4-amino-4,6-dideoxy-L-N-acetyl-beta-L-altrosamine transaminase
LSENKFFTIDKLSKEIISSRHLYPILLNKKLHPFKEEIFETLHKQGIGVQVHYKPIYQNSFYREKFGMTCQDVAEDFYNSELSIPCHQLMSLEDAQHVIDILLDTLTAYSLKVNNV